MRVAPSIGIIGAGFSGSLLAVHLLRRLPPGGRVYLIERNREFGSGLAYSTANASHLLNVRAERMSAFEQDPGHFLRWLADQGSEPGSSFVPRGQYGRYIQSLLSDQLSTEGGNRNLFLFPDEATDLDLGADGVTIRMSGGRPVEVDRVVLAVGNFPPQTPPGAEALAASPRYLPNPWDPTALVGIDRDAKLLVVGTGLTMVDFVLTLFDRGHRGPIVALSRRGLLPHRHAAGPPAWPWPDADSSPPLSRRLRQVRIAASERDWRAVFDGLRPHTPAWWGALSLPERKRFLRHLRPWWDVHRHRMAPPVADRIDLALSSGALTLAAGKFVAIDRREDGLVIDYRPRGREGWRRVAVDYVVNCSGPDSDYGRIEQKMVRALLDRGAVVPDILGLGLEVDADLRLLDRQGRPQPRLYGIGPVTRSRFWECTAVPEIRRQTEELAERLGAE